MAKIGYLFAKAAFDALRDKMDPRKVNGGVFLGLNGIVIKSHGGTDALRLRQRHRCRLRDGPARPDATRSASMLDACPGRRQAAAGAEGDLMANAVRSVVRGVRLLSAGARV